MVSSKLAVGSVSNQAFLHYLCALARSIRENAPEVHFHAHLINVTQDGVESVRQAMGRGEITVENIQLSKEEERGHSSNSRVYVVHKLLSSGFDVVVNMDPDALVRKGFSMILQHSLENYDVLLFRQSRIKKSNIGEKVHFLACMSIFKNGANAKTFVAKWLAELEPMRLEWFGDQIALFRAFEKTNVIVRVGDIPLGLLDWEFAFKSYVWMAKGNKKYSSSMFSLELEKYAPNRPASVVFFIILIKQLTLRGQFLFWKIKIAIISYLLYIRSFIRFKKKI